MVYFLPVESNFRLKFFILLLDVSLLKVQLKLSDTANKPFLSEFYSTVPSAFDWTGKAIMTLA